jgi:hypothetical protein
MHMFVVKKLDLIGRVVKKSILYHDVSHKQVASVGILLRSIWMCEKPCQITYERSVVFLQMHCMIYLGSHFHQNMTAII